MFTEGVLLLERVAKEGDLDRGAEGDRQGRHQGASRTPTGPVGARLAAAESDALTQVFAEHPLRDLLTTEGPVPVLRRPPARAVLELVRVLPALRGRPRRREDRQGRQRHPAHRRRAAAGRGRHGLRRDLPAADPPDRRGQPQGRQQHADPDARRRRLALGDRQQGRRARRHPPRPRHHRGLRRLRRRGRAARASRSRSTSPSRRRPTTRGRPSTPSGSPPAPTAPSRTPRTRRRSTRTSTRSTSTTTPRASTPRASGCCRYWMSHGVRIFRVDNPHTKPLEFWEWLLGRIRETDPDVLFLAEAFTLPPHDAALAARSASTSPTPLHLAQRPLASSRPTSTRCPTRPRT